MFLLSVRAAIVALVSVGCSVLAATRVQCNAKNLRFVVDRTSGVAPLTVTCKPIKDYDPWPNMPCQWIIDGGRVKGTLDELHTYTHTFTEPGQHTIAFSIYLKDLNNGIWLQIPYETNQRYARIQVEGSPVEPNTVDFIRQHGITWSFSEDVEAGQFINGDYWVVGPVTVASVSPAPSSGRNGSMINPSRVDQQAYDSRTSFYASSAGVTFPKELRPGDSLVSTISHSGSATQDVVGASVSSPRIDTAAVLTCLDKSPATPCFRPSYFGTDKSLYRESLMKLDLLPNLEAPSTTPNVDSFIRYFDRVWIDHLQDWMSRTMHPVSNMPNYGREIVRTVGDGGCLLCVEIDPEKKRELAIRMVQLGIDLYGVAQIHKHVWYTSGGHSPGRKFPILFAGLMLGNAGMLNMNDYDVGEDSCYFGESMNPVHTLWTGWQNSGHQYASNVLYRFSVNPSRGWADYRDHEDHNPTEWDDPPFPMNTNWPHDKHDPYRRLVSYAWLSQAMAARILGLKSYWQNDAYFAYCDRWVYENDVPNQQAIRAAYEDYNSAAKSVGAPGVTPTGGTFITNFAESMYKTYRSRY